MGRIEKTVFISYRRTNIPWALAIYQNLTSHGYDVFFDYDSIPSGDFEQVIIGNIRARAHFLVVLTPSALERCISPDDWLRREIETALDEKRNIIPIFLEGFDFGSPSISKYLTGKLKTLKKYNGQNVPAGFFEDAMRKIREKFLNVSLEAVLHPVSAIVKKEVNKQQVAASEATQVKEKELTAQEWFEKGLESQDFDEAIYHYTESIRLEPHYVEAYHIRGLTQAYRGELDNAIKDYSEAIRLNPDFAESYYGRGDVLYSKGDLDGAIEDYNKAIRLEPDFAEVYTSRGSVNLDNGNLDGAIEDYTKVILLKPNSAEAYIDRGLARHKKRDWEGAIKDYTESIRLQPDIADAYLNRGSACMENGNQDDAIKDYTEVIRLQPDAADAYCNRGSACMEKGDWNGAIKDYTESIRLNPDFEDVYCNRALAWEKKEDYYSAVADYQKYFDVGGTDEKVRLYLNDAKKKIK